MQKYLIVLAILGAGIGFRGGGGTPSPCADEVETTAWSPNASFAYLDGYDSNGPTIPQSPTYGRIVFANAVAGGDVTVKTVSSEQVIEIGEGVYDLETLLRGDTTGGGTTNARSVTYQWYSSPIGGTLTWTTVANGIVAGTNEINGKTNVSGENSVAKAVVCGPKYVQVQARMGTSSDSNLYGGLSSSCYAKVTKMENWGTDTNQSVQYRVASEDQNTTVVHNSTVAFELDTKRSPTASAYSLGSATDFSFLSKGFYRVSFNFTFNLYLDSQVTVEPRWSGSVVEYFGASTCIAPGSSSYLANSGKFNPMQARRLLST